ncbi:hypothetical protein BKA62DRAFT_720684 [Auriculariales sp. MPI-PUGE-AT-0066]|nr:hypothetical protein BKA62DRAFT_720684 [Auriculariales sp. MPI-PUGE-AT-0066]
MDICESLVWRYGRYLQWMPALPGWLPSPHTMPDGFLIPDAAYVRTAAFAVFAYDYTLTLEDEIALVWKNRWTRATVVYILIRYLTFSVLILDLYVGIRTHLSPETCKSAGIAAASLSIIVVALVQGIFVLRLYLIYNRKRLILWSGITFFVLQLVLWITLFYVLQGAFMRIQIPPDIIGSCYRWQDPVKTAMGWIPTLVFELWLASLAVWKYWREPRVSGPSILPHLVYDSIVYFVFVCAMMITTIAIFLSNPVDPGSAASGLMTSATGIGGTRVILNMRQLLLEPSMATEFSATQTVPLPTPQRSGARNRDHEIELTIVDDGATFDSRHDLGRRSPHGIV